ncbi:MAG: YraN family protein [Pseudomonadales bacterium]
MTPEGPRRRAGRAGEARAAAFLAARGYQLREQNWHCRYGEWDLILAAPEGRLWAFVEVRYRRRPLGGYTAATVTPAKQRRLTLAAQLYLAASATKERREPPPCRFDVIALTGPSPAEAHLEWIRNAFGEVN